MQNSLKSSYLSSFSETSFIFFFPGLCSPHFHLSGCFKLRKSPIHLFSQILHWVLIKVPTHGHIDSNLLYELRRISNFTPTVWVAKERDVFIPSMGHSANADIYLCLEWRHPRRHIISKLKIIKAQILQGVLYMIQQQTAQCRKDCSSNSTIDTNPYLIRQLL